jgi:hypothetical protein
VRLKFPVFSKILWLLKLRSNPQYLNATTPRFSGAFPEMDRSVNLYSIKEIYGRKNCEAIPASSAPSEAPLRAPRLNKMKFKLKNPMGEKILLNPLQILLAPKCLHSRSVSVFYFYL